MMSIRYIKRKNGINHTYWINGIREIKIDNENRCIELIIEDGIMTDTFIECKIEHEVRTFIHEKQHIVLKAAELKQHIRMYL